MDGMDTGEGFNFATCVYANLVLGCTSNRGIGLGICITCCTPGTKCAEVRVYAGHKVRRYNHIFGYWVSVNNDSCSSLAWHIAGALRSRECAILLDVFWRCVGGSCAHHLERLQFHFHSDDVRLCRCNICDSMACVYARPRSNVCRHHGYYQDEVLGHTPQ